MTSFCFSARKNTEKMLKKSTRYTSMGSIVDIFLPVTSRNVQVAGSGDKSLPLALRVFFFVHSQICKMKRGDSISSKFEELNQRSIDDKKDAYKFFMEQSPLARTKAEIKKHLEAAVAYRISVLTNVSTFGKSSLLQT